jgi:hypothetical protein
MDPDVLQGSITNKLVRMQVHVQVKEINGGSTDRRYERDPFLREET